jgi:hypothetical protein
MAVEDQSQLAKLAKVTNKVWRTTDHVDSLRPSLIRFVYAIIAKQKYVCNYIRRGSKVVGKGGTLWGRSHELRALKALSYQQGLGGLPQEKFENKLLRCDFLASDNQK